jgi:hypothetical protein
MKCFLQFTAVCKADILAATDIPFMVECIIFTLLTDPPSFSDRVLARSRKPEQLVRHRSGDNVIKLFYPKFTKFRDKLWRDFPP